MFKRPKAFISKKTDVGILIAIFLLVVSFLMLFFPYFVLDNLGWGGYKIVIKDYGRLGTFISGITAPFISLAALILLYLTYKSQKQELADSKTN